MAKKKKAPKYTSFTIGKGRLVYSGVHSIVVEEEVTLYHEVPKTKQVFEGDVHKAMRDLLSVQKLSSVPKWNLEWVIFILERNYQYTRKEIDWEDWYKKMESTERKRKI